MFLRRNRRIVDGQSYEYWTLVRTVRTAKGPRQEIVATLGKTPGLDQRTRHGWEDVAALLEGRPPARQACILTVARFCGQKSELEVAERWYAASALEDLLGVAVSQINDARLYRGLDALHAHKDQLCAHLQRRYESWFGVDF